MQELTIKLTGVINSSNFDEWKKSLTALIQSKTKELVTDYDFFVASDHVKSLRKAEKYLKDARESALNQAEEIQKLFSGIKEVGEEARQARLSLERQIKSQKLKIKNENIQSGIDDIKQYIDEHCTAEFECLDQSIYLDRVRFESAAKGKTSKAGLLDAINRLCIKIKEEISRKNFEINNNKSKLDGLPKEYEILFPDWKNLISLSEKELELITDKRITRYKEDIARKEAEKARKEAEKHIEINNNKSKLDGLPKEYEMLFLDREDLISLNEKELELIIDTRITRFKGSDDQGAGTGVVPEFLRHELQHQDIALKEAGEHKPELNNNEETEFEPKGNEDDLLACVEDALNKLNKTDYFYYLDIYYPTRYEQHDSCDFSKSILNFKNHLDLLPFFKDKLNEIELPKGVSICSVPGHESTRGATNLRILSLEFCRENDLEDLSCCLKRYKTVGKSSYGLANRDKSKTIDSVSLVFKERLKDKVVVLIDDLGVTGNTILACRDILSKSEVRHVFCLAFGATN